MGPAPVFVKRQGRACTVYLDEREQPMHIAGFEDQPVGGFPYTARAEEISARFAGRPLVFIDPPAAPNPAAPPLTKLQEQEVARIMREAGNAQAAAAALAPVAATAPTPQQVPQQAAPPPQVDVVALLSQAFERQVEDSEADAEVVGTFLINVFPELEPVLKEAAERARQPKAKRAFRL